MSIRYGNLQYEKQFGPRYELYAPEKACQRRKMYDLGCMEEHYMYITRRNVSLTRQQLFTSMVVFRDRSRHVLYLILSPRPLPRRVTILYYE